MMLGKNVIVHSLAVAAALMGGFARSAFAQVTFDRAIVGNPGNAADPVFSVGSVPDVYRIAKHEVTNDQYA